MTYRTRIHALALLLVAAAGSIAKADPPILGPGVYRMHNHPDGAVRQPYYGLRLDELYNVGTGHDIWTFDFDAAGSAMYLQITETLTTRSIHIFGTSYGGLDVGAVYDANNSGFWDIDFTYNDVTVHPGDDDLWVTTPNYSNQGTVTPSTGNTAPVVVLDDDSVEIYDFAGNNGYTFRLGNETNDLGHRGHNGVSGWGWLNYQAGPAHVNSTDWLFTLDTKPLPVPGAVYLGALGLAFAARFRKRLGSTPACA